MKTAAAERGWSLRVEPGVIRVSGSLLRAELDRQPGDLPADAVGPTVDVHLGQVGRIDTAGLAWLAAIQADAEAKGIRLRYTHAPQAMRQMLAVYGLEGLMPVDSGLD
ncbi:STAS domain-containing protein [Guyparkeria halophila]|uniref:STAS domain-containing protein n=1 Tax=Guyparkeria halophila TaxID=47960 RepID=A0ABZ0YUY4_9GAMM|nr:STAS domain-containing protein [Guyparkeria halophila]WQH15558.1 STAS domain-containing protein [Guyparkeria halophila]